MFQDGRALGARNVIASSDSTLFLDPTTAAVRTVSTRTIKKVIFTNRGKGFLEGFGVGAAVGTVVTLVFYAIFGDQIELDPGGVVAVGVAGALAGGAIGGITGLIIGHTNEYSFVTSADSTKR